MSLTPQDESKSFRIISKNENNEDVFAANATYNRRNISVNFEMLNPTYCSEHVDDVSGAITTFLTRLNEALLEDNFPIINT